MRRKHVLAGIASAGLVAASLVLAAGGVVVAAVPQAAQAAAPPCHAGNLAISKAGRDGAAGNFYQHIKITNVSDGRCRLGGFPSFRWRRNGHDIGWSSVREPGQSASTVVIRPGHAAYTTLHWFNTGAIPPAQCRAKKATAVHMTLFFRPHVYRIAISADVCTTKKYRPRAYPVRNSPLV
jgi:hypothetical protein